jgi:hypothetical protein
MRRTPLTFRVSAEERKAIEAKAKAAGLEVSEWLRKMAMAAPMFLPIKWQDAKDLWK